MTTPKQHLKAITRALTPASPCGNSRGCETDKLPHGTHADEIVRIGHTGWFTDEFQDEKYRGMVWELCDDAERKDSIFLAGYDEGSGYCCLSCSGGKLDTFDSAEEAARAADGLAERNAEREREYQENWRAASDLSEEIDSLKDKASATRAEWREAATVARVNPFLDMAARAKSRAATLRATHRAVIGDISDKRAEIVALGMAGEF